MTASPASEVPGDYQRMAADPDWLAAWLGAHGLPGDAPVTEVLRAVGRDFQGWATEVPQGGRPADWYATDVETAATALAGADGSTCFGPLADERQDERETYRVRVDVVLDTLGYRKLVGAESQYRQLWLAGVGLRRLQPAGPPDDPERIRAWLREHADTKLSADNERLAAKVASYEEAITWDTTCLGCSSVLTASYEHLVRAEKAEGERDGLADTLRQVRENATDPALIRWCEWPGCLRSFAAHTGPVGDLGWVLARTPGRTLLCPGHAAAGHLPGYEVRTAEGWSMAATCSCGERVLPEPANGRGAMDWWSRHVAALGEAGTGQPGDVPISAHGPEGEEIRTPRPKVTFTPGRGPLPNLGPPIQGPDEPAYFAAPETDTDRTGDTDSG